MNSFYDLKVAEVCKETDDCVSIVLQPAEDDQSAFQYEAGQYLTLKTEIEGSEVRRSYSICSAPSDPELRVAVKRVPGGLFSHWANVNLKAGDTIQSMAPQGRFILKTNPKAEKNYVAFVAGSGITPVLSQIREVLKSEPLSTFTLFYVNRETATIIFRTQLQELKDLYMQQFRMFHLLTQEPLEAELFHGRLDEERCNRILSSNLLDLNSCAGAFLCGPEPMIMACKSALETAGLEPEKIHFELFTSAAQKEHSPAVEIGSKAPVISKKLSIVLDGVTTMVEIKGEKTIMDAALDAGLDAPYSCLGGVCCTCRAKMTKGSVRMDVNYALEASEVERGFVLTCQSRLEGEGPFEVDYDQQ